MFIQEDPEDWCERPHAAEVQGPWVDRADRCGGQAEGKGHQVHEEGSAEAVHAGRGQVQQAAEGHLPDCAAIMSEFIYREVHLFGKKG